MTLSPQQLAMLAEPLSRANVKQRSQAGRSLSYIEGWHAIAEANRIFGFDRWSRETVEIRQVAEHERSVGQGKGWGVTYFARVRVRVWGEPNERGESVAVTREGCGTGHGIDRDLGQAHESAIKEAETDAMKRALMTFGFQFGLALYDKAQTHVVDLSGGYINETQRDHLMNLIDRSGADLEAFVNYFNIGSVGEMSVSRYDEAQRMLLAKMEKKA